MAPSDPSGGDFETRLTGAPAGPQTGNLGPLAAGQAFGPRYRIIRPLGAGGMGVVYQAWDEELGEAVALKIIRPEAVADPFAAQEVERRFKRELVLARQVTHKHVVRIHDLGEIDGIKYLTMPYVQGEDLGALLKRSGRLPVPRAVAIARQVTSGLAAAHEVGVVHRDLKPDNIMITAEGQALIMDFGIARSVVGTTGAGTALGSVVGTLEYMAPEQAQGQPVDQRADIYAFGLILYDMLLGLRRFSGGESAVADMMKRVQEPPAPLRTRDASVPEGLERVVARCLQPDAGRRYQTTAELVAALDRLDEHGQELPAPAALRPRLPVALIAMVVLLIGMVAGGWWALGGRGTTPPAAVDREPLSVLVADFENRTGDDTFEGSLEQALGIAMEGAPFISAYRRNDARRIAADIKPDSGLDEEVARLVSLREGIKVVLSGSIETRDRGYSIEMKAVDPTDGRILSAGIGTAAGKGDVLGVIGRLASRVRSDLGDQTPESVRQTAAETFTASSLEAVRHYSIAQDLAAARREEEAIEHYRQAVEADPDFGRAYSGWATSAFYLGRADEAEELWKKALSLMDRMTDREKYRTLGLYYLAVARNFEMAIENYSNLVERYPADGVGHNNLAYAYFATRNFPKALEEGRRALEIYPGNLTVRNNYALYAMYASDFETAASAAERVLELDRTFWKPYFVKAMVALAAGDGAAARQAYDAMAEASAHGASVASVGKADVAMYEGRAAEARRLLAEGLRADEQADNRASLLARHLTLAEAHLADGRTGEALESVGRALELDRQLGTLVTAALVYARAGREADARRLARELEEQLQPQARAYAQVTEGMLALERRRYPEAVDAFRSAVRLSDLWLARLGLGIAYVEAGHFIEALAELELCQKRRGEATAIFMNDVPTFRVLAPVSYWLGRAQEGSNLTARARASYQAYVDLREAAGGDPLLEDARGRLAGLAP